MRNRCYRLLLSLALASASFAACGGATESDRGHAGDDSGVAGEAGIADVASDLDADAAADGAGDGGTDVAVETCGVCSVAEYTCSQVQMESVTYVPVEIQPDSCLFDNPNGGPGPYEVHCDPLEICCISGCGCFPVTEEGNGIISWKNAVTQVICYPKIKKASPDAAQ